MAQRLRMFLVLTGGLYSVPNITQTTHNCMQFHLERTQSSPSLASEGTHSQMHMLIPRHLHGHTILLKNL